MPLRAVLLDAGGTIVFPSFRRIADEFAREGVSIDPERLERAELRVRFEFDRPEVIGTSNDRDRWARFLQRMAEEAGLTAFPRAAFLRLKEYQDRHNLWEVVPADVPPALDALARRYRLGVVSNANGTVRALFDRLGLASRFEVVIDSHEEGMEKPDPRLFRVALDRMKIDPAETAYVGDLYHVDVVGARAAGLHAILLDPHGLHGDKDCRRVRHLAELASDGAAGPA